MAKKGDFVLVTTDKNGVFAGVLQQWDDDKNTITLEDAQMCVYWSQEMHGLLGLGQQGPNKDCRITPSVPELSLNGVTAVIVTTDEAQENWKKKFWSDN